MDVKNYFYPHIDGLEIAAKIVMIFVGLEPIVILAILAIRC